MRIGLTFLNRSLDVNRSDMAIFQRNRAAPTEAPPLLWTLIRGCPPGWHRRLSFDWRLQLSVGDASGNRTSRIDLQPGHEIILHPHERDRIGFSARAVGPPIGNRITNLTGRPLDAEIFRGGRLLARHAGLAPGRSACFEFDRCVQMTAVSGLEEGSLLPQTELRWRPLSLIDLAGLTEARIFMLGGGWGAEAAPLFFRRWPAR